MGAITGTGGATIGIGAGTGGGATMGAGNGAGTALATGSDGTWAGAGGAALYGDTAGVDLATEGIGVVGVIAVGLYVESAGAIGSAAWPGFAGVPAVAKYGDGIGADAAGLAGIGMVIGIRAGGGKSIDSGSGASWAAGPCRPAGRSMAAAGRPSSPSKPAS